MRRANDPAYLPTVSMQDLYENVYPSRAPVIDGLLYAGTYLFVGAPKVGKSFLMEMCIRDSSKFVGRVPGGGPAAHRGAGRGALHGHGGMYAGGRS